MTCIAAYTDGNKVWVGGDSAGVAGLRLTVRADEKVFTRKDKKDNAWAFGFTSSFRMGQLIRYELDLPALPTKDFDLDEFMVKEFISELRKCLKEGGFQKTSSQVESGGSFIVGLKGNIFVIHSDYQVAKPVKPFEAVGCGEDIAKGALYILDKAKTTPPKAKVLFALRASEQFSGGVRGPFRVVEA